MNEIEEIPYDDMWKRQPDGTVHLKEKYKSFVFIVVNEDDFEKSVRANPSLTER